MRSGGLRRLRTADREPDARVDLGRTRVLEHDVVDAPVGRDRREAALGHDQQQRHRQPGRAQDLREGLGAGEVRARVEEDEVGLGARTS